MATRGYGQDNLPDGNPAVRGALGHPPAPASLRSFYKLGDEVSGGNNSSLSAGGLSAETARST